jgi:hypothetical protein
MPALDGHRPSLIHRKDGRWEVRCAECERREEVAPIGIGIPIMSKTEAESIALNHASTAS